MSEANVVVTGKAVGAIGRGLLIFVGITHGDNETDAEYLARKITHLRVFEDEDGRMNRSLIEIEGEALVVSQFTLYGDCRKGRRPSFDQAADPKEAKRLYEYFLKQMDRGGLRVKSGVFQATMKVSLVNEGPVTFIVESKKIETES